MSSSGASRRSKSALVVWLHGLGDTGEGWSELERSLGPKLPHVHWVFPDAPIQSVSCNWGMQMPSWFDLPELPVGPGSREDVKSYQSAIKKVHKRMREEMEKQKIPPNRVVIGGFSQGGAIATQAMLQFPEKLAGGVNFSGWLVGRDEIQSKIQAPNADTSLLWCHGGSDPTVLTDNQEQGVPFLKGLGIPVEHHTYNGMGHSACPEEFEVLRQFLVNRIP